MGKSVSIMSSQELTVYMHSLWLALEEEEYITMKSLQFNHHIPQILGTCGPIYGMEYSPPGPILSFRMSLLSSHKPWEERAIIALGLLDLIESFADIGHVHKQLHLCDIKGENFGIGRDGVIKAIDVDMAFVEHKLGDELGYSSCTQHKDCDFFDCWGWCDYKNNKCTRLRRNNNLQVIKLCSSPKSIASALF